jgi:hypothetical protein
MKRERRNRTDRPGPTPGSREGRARAGRVAGGAWDSAALARPVTRAALVVTASFALAGHLVFLANAGGLWRDEANTVAFAQMPSLPVLVAHLRYDSVPLLSTMLVRGWIGLGLGSDRALRVLGCLIGCAILGALVLSARVSRATLPACSLLLLALNAWAIRGGDSIRPTGLGMLFIVLSFASLAAALERPGPGRAALAALCATLSVQSLYLNIPLVAGISLGGMAVGLVTHSRVRTLISAGVGALAALSLIPYFPAIRATSEWTPLVQAGSDPGRFLAVFREAAAPDAWAWVALPMAAVFVAARRAFRAVPPAAESDRMFSIYSSVTWIAATVAIAVFWIWSHLAFQPWYFLPWMALAAAAADAALGPALRPAPRQILAGGILIAAAAGHFAIGLGALERRQTNVDLIAAKLREAAGPGDLVLVNPWYLGIPFSRYERGPARWMTVPPLSDTSIHRFDLLKQAMQDPEVTDSVVGAVSETLRRGGTVWLVGAPRRVRGAFPTHAPRAPAPGLGWSVNAYTDLWSSIVLDTIREHADRFEQVPIPSEHGINPRELELLFKASGWR